MQDGQDAGLLALREGLLLVARGPLHLACVVLGLAVWGDVAFFAVGGIQMSVGFLWPTEVTLGLLTASQCLLGHLPLAQVVLRVRELERRRGFTLTLMNYYLGSQLRWSNMRRCMNRLPKSFSRCNDSCCVHLNQILSRQPWSSSLSTFVRAFNLHRPAWRLVRFVAWS